MARPPANWSAPAGVSTMTWGPRCTRWPAVALFTTAPRSPHEAAAPRGGLLRQPRPVPSPAPRPHRRAARLTSAGTSTPAWWCLYRHLALIWKNDGNARPASIWEQSLNPDRRSVTGRPVRSHQRRPGPGLVALTAAAGRSRNSARVPPRKRLAEVITGPSHPRAKVRR